MTTLYNCRHSGDQYRITKFDDSFNPESSYLCDLESCECPAGHRPTCRHRTMLPKFIERGHIGDGWLYDHDRNGWVHGPATFIDEASSIPESMWALAGKALPLQPKPIIGDYITVDLFPDSITMLSQPYSTVVSAADFESADIGSNPIGAAKEPAIGTIRRRV